MSLYNIQVYDYLGHKQVRIYKRPVAYGEEKAENKIKDSEKENKKSDAEKQEHSKYVSINRTKQSIYEYGYANRWSMFGTLTFSEQSCDRYDYEEICKKTSKWLNNQKNSCAKDLVYLYIPEKHPSSGAYHIHILLANTGNLTFVDSGRVSKNGKAYKRTENNSDCPTIYNLPQWRYGFTAFTKVQNSDKCVSYISKYITKELCEVAKFKRRFFPSHNCKRCEVAKYYWNDDDIRDMVMDWYENDLVEHSKSQKIPEASQIIHYYEIKGENGL
ncbi:MAG: hypothetical protein MRZ65_09070 [Lachnospiraceae bacterium]|nr:hypothetical protein [Lachnospiraceae bacterium]